MADFDTVIKDGTIVDGTGVPRYRADVGIKNGRIAKLGRIKRNEAERILEANGLIVAPGAVDLHTHFDAPLFWDPYCSIAGWHGVTTVTIGNCGFGFAPLRAKDAERLMLSFSRNESIALEPMKVSMLPLQWETFPQLMDHLERRPLGVNIGHLVPVSSVVAYVMGGVDEAKQQQPNQKQMQEILSIFHQAMDAGAMGWSAQRLLPEGTFSVQRDYDGTPMISDLLSDKFYLTLAEALGERSEGYVEITQLGSSQFEPGEGLVRDIEFAGRLAEVSGRPVAYNTVTVADSFPEVFRSQLRALDKLNAKGIRVFGQTESVRLAISFTFEDWNLYDNSPIWRNATLGTVQERKAKLADPTIRRQLIEEFDKGSMPIMLTPEYIARSVHRPDLKEKYEGRVLGEIAKQEQKHLIEVMLDISVGDDLRTVWEAPIPNADPDLAKELLSHPYILAGVSDGGAHVKFSTLGIYPTDLLTWLVRDTERLSLEEAHYHLSYLPAWAAGFKDRGCLREGMAADIVVYDLQRLGVGPSEVVHDMPTGDWRRIQRAKGYRWIMVNGTVTFEEGKCTGQTPGKLLRHGRASG